MKLRNLFKRKPLKEIQNVYELVKTPIGTTVIYKGMKIRVTASGGKKGCGDCVLHYNPEMGKHATECFKVPCGPARSDGKSAVYIQKPYKS